MKQAVFVVIGMVISAVGYALLCVYIVTGYLHMTGCAGMGPAFLIMAPVSLAAGGMVTGFLSRPLLDTKLGLIWIAPGLYLCILMLCNFFLFAILDVVAGDIGRVGSEILWMLLFFLYLYSASLAGTGLGYFMRGLIGRLRKSD